MQLTLQDDLPFVQVALAYQDKTISIDHVLVDTGSASTIFAARAVALIGVLPEMTDTVYTCAASAGRKPCSHATSSTCRSKRRWSMTSRSRLAA